MDEVLRAYRENEDILQYCPLRFLSRHEGKDARTLWSGYRISRTTALLFLIYQLARQTAIAITRFVLALSMIQHKTRRCGEELSSDKPTILIHYTTNYKYSTESQHLALSLKRRKAHVVYVDPDTCTIKSLNGKTISTFQNPIDHIRAVLSSVILFARIIPTCLSHNSLRRTLAAQSARYILWNQTKQIAFKRLVLHFSINTGFFTFLPFNSAAQLLVEEANKGGHPTFAMRSQTTNILPELSLINCSYLFYKSHYEKYVYEHLIESNAIQLAPGCIFSLPQQTDVSTSPPSSYALILGTAPAADERAEDYSEALLTGISLAKTSRLPIVLRSHPLSRTIDEKIIGSRELQKPEGLMAANASLFELIQHASIVFSFPSTALYQCILQEKPIVVFTSEKRYDLGEFHDAPLCSVDIDKASPLASSLFTDAVENTACVKAWLDREYYYRTHGLAVVADVIFRSLKFG